MSDFAKDVHSGLSAPSKHLSSKYFYDEAGSRIFQQIMHMPEYYLTNSEFEILSTKGHSILQKTGFKGPFTVVEFGAGDGLKTKQFLLSLLGEEVSFSYMPVDISTEALNQLQANMRRDLSTISILPVQGDYFSRLDNIRHPDTPVLALFLGSNIGNFNNKNSSYILRSFYDWMKPGDQLLLGFDLRKNPNTIRAAYDDPHGITRSFNLNLLCRINRELGGEFDIDTFDFYCDYDPLEGEVHSYLVSLKDQDVRISALGRSYHFDQNELIWTELSKKFSVEEMRELAGNTGFRHIEIFRDCRHYFADALWLKE